MEDFLAITIVGALLSGVVEFTKGMFGESSTKTKLIVIGLSILVGGIYAFLRSTVYWATMVIVLTSASTVYALLLKK